MMRWVNPETAMTVFQAINPKADQMTTTKILDSMDTGGLNEKLLEWLNYGLKSDLEHGLEERWIFEVGEVVMNITYALFLFIQPSTLCFCLISLAISSCFPSSLIWLPFFICLLCTLSVNSFMEDFFPVMKGGKFVWHSPTARRGRARGGGGHSSTYFSGRKGILPKRLRLLRIIKEEGTRKELASIMKTFPEAMSRPPFTSLPENRLLDARE